MLNFVPNFHNNEASNSLSNICIECGCKCSRCRTSLDLHEEIQCLEAKLQDLRSHEHQLKEDYETKIHAMKNDFNKNNEDMFRLRDRYERLSEAYKHLQRLNNQLEDKFITFIESLQEEKSDLLADSRSMSEKLKDAAIAIKVLEEKCTKYKDDCNVAVHLLHTRPSDFVAQRLENLPIDIQDTLKFNNPTCTSIPRSASEQSFLSIIPTFPPTAAFMSMPPPTDTSPSLKTSNNIQVSLIADALKDRRNRNEYVCAICGSPEITTIDQYHHQLDLSNISIHKTVIK